MPRIRNKAQKGRFLIVGASATAIDFGLLFVFRYLLNLPVIPANIASTGIAFCYSFLANKKYTFKTSSTNIVREMALFTITTLFGLWVIQSIIIEILHPTIEQFTHGSIALFVSKLIATGATMIWNYLMYSRVVFPKAPKTNTD